MDYPNVQRVIQEVVDEGLLPDYVFELNYEFPRDSWVQYCKIISILQERAFSMLKYIYTDQQSHSMVDLIKTT